MEERWAKHRSGEGAEFLKKANEAGINWLVVRVWMGVGPDKEKSIKGMQAKFICPVCKAKQAELAKHRKMLQVSRARSGSPVSVEAA